MGLIFAVLAALIVLLEAMRPRSDDFSHRQ
jgi:hypothetical protein